MELAARLAPQSSLCFVFDSLTVPSRPHGSLRAAFMESYAKEKGAQVCFAATEEDETEQQAKEQPTKFWETKTWNTDKIPWKKQIEMLICLNRYLYLVTHSPRKNAWRPGFVFLAELALQSDDHIETCDIYLEKHLCRCYVLPEHHKIISMLPRHFDVSVVTTQSQDLKHTQYHHLDLTHSTTKWESIVYSVGVRYAILNAVCMGTTHDQAWIVRESPKSTVLHHLMRANKPSCMAGHVGHVGLSLFDAIEEHTIEAYLVRHMPRTVWRSDPLD